MADDRAVGGRWRRRPLLGLLASLVLAACGAPARRGATPTVPAPPSSLGDVPSPTAGTPVAVPLGTPAFPASPGSWHYAGSMREARVGHTITLLSDGTVLVVGGGPEPNKPIASVERYDPATGSWSVADSLPEARSAHTATLLPGGDLLVAGGYGGSGRGNLTSAVRFDPATGRWRSAGQMASPRIGHTATPLPIGQILVVGGNAGDPPGATIAELYDPATDSWQPAAAPGSPRIGHTATLLADGIVLVVGGAVASASVERYDPASGRWSGVGSLARGRQYHAAAMLPDGQVLVVGGATDDPMSGETVGTAERYDPVADRWLPAGILSTPRVGLIAVALPGGQVLVAGGVGNARMGRPLDTVDRYDPATNTWSTGPALEASRSGHTATALPDGDLLIVGGTEGTTAGPVARVLATAERYSARPAAQRPPIPTRPSAPSPWQAAGALSTARERHATIDLRDGRILAIGGAGTDGPLSSVERYDPAINSWATVAPLTAPRADHTATLLHDGRVLIVGGTAGDGAWFAATELYDPQTDRWFPAAPLTVARVGHTATLIHNSLSAPNAYLAANGHVLLVGGIGNGGVLAAAERYDPRANRWFPVANLGTARLGHTATALPGGQILVAGGATGPGATALATTERYDPATDSWRTAAPLATARTGHAAAAVNFGRVYLFGGADRAAADGELLASVEDYDATLDRWHAARSMAVARYQPIVADLSGSTMLVVGATRAAAPEPMIERHDFSSGWLPVGGLHTRRTGHTATVFHVLHTYQPRVLVVGGRATNGRLLDSAEVYSDVPPPYKPPPTPTPATP